MRFVEFKNRITGTQMWVAEDRVEEYKAAGHTLAAVASQKSTDEQPVVTAKTPVKKAAKKK